VFCTDCDCIFFEVQTEILYMIWKNVILHRPSELTFWKRFLHQNYVRISFFCRPINSPACCPLPVLCFIPNSCFVNVDREVLLLDIPKYFPFLTSKEEVNHILCSYDSIVCFAYRLTVIRYHHNTV
jgi:hypothetical protein